VRVLFVYENRERVPLPVAPLGMLTVASATARAGHEVRALDLSFSRRPRAEIERALSGFEPDVVAISLRILNQWFTSRSGRRVYHIDRCKALVDLLRRLTRNPIVIGGPGFSHTPLEAFRFLRPDYGIEGEGEESLPKLLSALATGSCVEGIPGLLWWRGDSEIGRNPPSLLEDLDSVPVQELGLIPYGRYLRRGGYVSINTSRGCNRSCVYCDDPAKSRCRVRTRSAEAVVDEIARIERNYGYRYYYIADSNFTAAPGHAAAFCEELLRRNVRVHWETDANPGDLSEELVALMKQAGCGAVTLGIDSGSSRMLKNYRKGFTQAQVARVASWLKKYKLPFMFTVIVGGPGESQETFRETVRFLESIDSPDMIFFNLGVDVYRGTKMLEVAKAEGQLPENPDFMRGVGYVSAQIGWGFRQEINRTCAAHPGWVNESFTSSRTCRFCQGFLTLLGRRPAWRGAAGAVGIVAKIPLAGAPKGD